MSTKCPDCTPYQPTPSRVDVYGPSARRAQATGRLESGLVWVRVVHVDGRCGGITAVVGKMPTLLGGTLQLLTVDVITFNHGGIVTDCALDVMVRLVD